MAWIYNKKTKVLTECRNNDVIKICKKDTERYAVDEVEENLLKITEDKKESADKTEKNLNEYKVAELKEMAIKRGIEGCDSLTKAELLNVLGN